MKASSIARLLVGLLALGLAACPPSQLCGIDSPCPDGMQCNAGVCEPKPCDCGPDEACVGKACLPRWCPQALPDGGIDPVTCIAGTGCVGGDPGSGVGGTCLTSDCPAGCQAGLECALGSCRPQDCFAGMACPEGLLCQAGRCATLACANTACGPGELCVGGSCVPEGCPGAPCLPGEVCWGGACVSATCAGIPCPDGQRCGNGRCWPVDCGGITCGDGLVCAGGLCVTSDCAGIGCPGARVCANGSCYEPSCPSASCPLGWVCADGNCVEPLCAGLQCPFGEQCIAGFCAGDRDGDGVPDASDNCPDMPNPGQANADSDPVGDACDCQPSDATRYPGASESCDQIDQDCDGVADEGLATVVTYRDADNDTWGDANVTKDQCALFAGWVSRSGDCDDTASTTNPGASELCADGKDNNCNGQTDEGTPTFYRDADGDGHGDIAAVDTRQECNPPAGYVAVADDCDDTRSNVYPGRAETCDGLDNDCDTLIDELVQTTYYRDADGDGYGNPGITTLACSAPAGYVANNTDCNDADGTLNPNTLWYRDADSDGYGDPNVTQRSCTRPGATIGTWVRVAGDCNDASGAIHPGVLDVCDGVNNDCDAQTDENPNVAWYADYDLDGYGDQGGSAVMACSNPDGDPLNPPAYVQNHTDCNDGNAAIHPGTADACGDGIDSDCNGGDGEAERCDGQDNDCDGVPDDVRTAQGTLLTQPLTTSNLAANNYVCNVSGMVSGGQTYYYQTALGTTTVTDLVGTAYSVSSCVRAAIERAPAWVTSVSVYESPLKPNAGAPCGSNNASGGAQYVKVFAVNASDQIVFLGQSYVVGCNSQKSCNDASRTVSISACATGGAGCDPSNRGIYAKALLVCRTATAAASNNLEASSLSVLNTCTQ